MANLEVKIEYMQPQTLYGLWKKSNDKTVSKDIKALSKQVNAVLSRPEGKVLPYFVLSRNYKEQSGDFELFIGSVTRKDGFVELGLLGGEYAKITVKPKLGFLWGPAVGEAKRYFYKSWLPASPFKALNMEYEHHTEKSMGKQPEIDVIFAVRRKAVCEDK